MYPHNKPAGFLKSINTQSTKILLFWIEVGTCINRKVMNFQCNFLYSVVTNNTSKLDYPVHNITPFCVRYTNTIPPNVYSRETWETKANSRTACAKAIMLTLEVIDTWKRMYLSSSCQALPELLNFFLEYTFSRSKSCLKVLQI